MVGRGGEDKGGTRKESNVYSIQYTENSSVEVILLTDMKGNWILQSPALSQTSGMDSTTGNQLALNKPCV